MLQGARSNAGVQKVCFSTLWDCNSETQTLLIAYLCDHFTTFTRPYLGEELQNQNFCNIPGEVFHIPGGEREGPF